MLSIDIIEIAAAILALLVAIIGHEIMHGYIAYKYGDMTAKDAGRLTINPISHIDPIGSIVVPALMYFLPMLLGGGAGFLFGWAKPVPINIEKVIRNGGYNAAMQVSLAGIAYNFALAGFTSVVLLGMSVPTQADSLLYIAAYIFAVKLLLINVVLGVFNLLPIPQFDGAHFLMYLSMKMRWSKVAEFFYKAEPYGMIIVLVVLMTPLKDIVLFAPIQAVLRLLVG